MIVKDEEKSREQLVSELVELRKWAKKLQYLYDEYEHADPSCEILGVDPSQVRISSLPCARQTVVDQCQLSY